MSAFLSKHLLFFSFDCNEHEKTKLSTPLVLFYAFYALQHHYHLKLSIALALLPFRTSFPRCWRLWNGSSWVGRTAGKRLFYLVLLPFSPLRSLFPRVSIRVLLRCASLSLLLGFQRWRRGICARMDWTDGRKDRGKGKGKRAVGVGGMPVGVHSGFKT